MKKIRFQYKHLSIRFRRWSRKNYAVFAGLNKVISIGHLASAITEKALAKTQHTIRQDLSILFDLTEIEKEEKENELLQDLLQIQANVVSVSADNYQENSLKYYTFNSRLNFALLC